MRQHFLDIGAGGKGLFRAGYDNAADAFILVEAVERGSKFGNQFRIQSVQGFRPVERDQADLATFFDTDVLVSHFACSQCQHLSVLRDMPNRRGAGLARSAKGGT